MKIDRVTYEPGVLLDFYDESLSALGAVCSRSWHDRLEVLAEGPPARLWNADGALQAVELQFAAPGETGARDAARDVFPGCPLTFRLAEALRPSPLGVERVTLAPDRLAARAPDPAVAEKLWRGQFPDTVRWRPTAPFAAAFHFSLVALVRCELQAIDQHWSLHRMALSLPNGRADEGLARDVAFAELDTGMRQPEAWPAGDAAEWTRLIAAAMPGEIAADLAAVRARQERQLGHELARVEEYFDHYERELTERARRGSTAKLKLAERLAAARAERDRHRADQVARHEIAVIPHVDSLLLVAEPAWRATLQVERAHQAPEAVVAQFVPRSRRWEAAPEERRGPIQRGRD